MALTQLSESDEEEYHSFSSPDEFRNGDDEDAESDAPNEPPVHPIAVMQGAFEESIFESTLEERPKSAPNSDADVRRQRLLDAKSYDATWTTRWRQRAGAVHHPLLKLMAQIVFGMHLLQQQAAKSDAEVVKILQTHVNEVDSFLERTSEDFELAIVDIEERVTHLKLPMSHLDVFNTMLDDKHFRTQLLDGNDKIEKIIDRTAKAMNGALMDVQQGIQATGELGRYLDDVQGQWPSTKQDIADVFSAMRGNEQGWLRFLGELQTSGNRLGRLLVELGTVIGEISKLAAAANRRNRPQSEPMSPSIPPNSPGLRSKFSPEAKSLKGSRMSLPSVLNKPLPKEPDVVDGAARAASLGSRKSTTAKPARAQSSTVQPVPFAQRYEQPRKSPPSPPVRKPKPVSDWDRVTTYDMNKPPRPKTAGAAEGASSPARPKTAGSIARDPRFSRNDTSDLADFLKHSGPARARIPQHSSPLRSNPPDASRRIDSKRAVERRIGRSHSQGANDILNATQGGKSHGTAIVLDRSAQTPPFHIPPPDRPPPSRPSSRGTDRALSIKSMPASRKDSVAGYDFLTIMRICTTADIVKHRLCTPSLGAQEVPAPDPRNIAHLGQIRCARRFRLLLWN